MGRSAEEVRRKAANGDLADAPLTSDAGLLPLRQSDERIGLTRQFAAAPYAGVPGLEEEAPRARAGTLSDALQAVSPVAAGRVLGGMLRRNVSSLCRAAPRLDTMN